MSSKKGKGKPRPNKPPNPNPPQKQEEPIKDVEKLENVLKESIESPQKVEERVPEIISEVITLPVLELKDKEGDSPKKPKRNRGKKKKNDKDDDENQHSDGADEFNVQIVEIEAQETTVEEIVTPNVRKKKNKNKKGADSDPKIVDQSEKESPMVEDKKPEKMDINVKEQAQVQDAEDNKPSKKKNKKKKQRNDSERSDKAREVSCTTAFLDLLRDDAQSAKDLKKDDVTSPEVTLGDKKDSERKATTNIQEVDKEIETNKESLDTAKLPANESESKTKKKSKKEKKEPPKEKEAEVSAEPFIVPENPLIASIESILKDELVCIDKATAEKQPIVKSSAKNVLKNEEDVKTKAKIAKPVGRKRKDKDTPGQELPAQPVEDKELKIKELITPEPLAEDSFETVIFPSQPELKTESIKDDKAVPEVLSEKKVKEISTHPTKRKEKGDKRDQGQQLAEMVSPQGHSTVKEVLKSPNIVVLEKSAALSHIEVDDSKENKPFLPEIIKQDEKHLGKKQKGKKNLSQELLDIKQEKESAFEELPSPVIISHQDRVQLENIEDPKKLQRAEAPEEYENISAKNVEKKKKGTADHHKNKMVVSEITSSTEESTKEVTCDPVLKPANISLFGNIVKDLITTMPEPIENIERKQELLGDPEVKAMTIRTEDLEATFINLPENPMDKKRKKSPKPHKQDQKYKVSDIKPEVIFEPVDLSKLEVLPPTKLELKEEEILAPFSQKVTEKDSETREKILVHVTDPILETEELQVKEDIKSKKKRKKSPKLPQEPEPVKLESKPTQLEKSEVTPKTEFKPVKFENIIQAKSDLFYNIPPVEDIEIRSLKADESEGSTCGFSPDIIQYPRATSQDLLDDNNNMSIQEITVAEEMKLQIPMEIPDTPFIKGSGVTPLGPPESIIVGSKVSQMSAGNKSEPEKTDIKSKMMEVNQDMEELRLSIERSLAELTSIEKSEKEVEKKYDEKTILGSEPKPSEVKISMPSEIIAKTPPKFEEISKPALPLPPDAIKQAEIIIPAETPESIEKSLIKDVKVTTPGYTPVATVASEPKAIESSDNISVPPVPPMRKSASKEPETIIKTPDDVKHTHVTIPTQTTQVKDAPALSETGETTSPPVCPVRKENKNKGKNKKKGKQELTQAVQSEAHSSTTELKDTSKTKKDEKIEKKPESTQEKGKQKTDATLDETNKDVDTSKSPQNFDPIENFEDAMTSSADDINQTFEIIADEAKRSIQASHVNPEIKIVAPVEDTKTDKRDAKINPVSPSKNLQGLPDIPVRSNKTDFKKEKNKTPNAVLAKVKIKDAVEIEAKKQTKDTQTDNIQKFLKSKSVDESFSSMTNENEEFVYKYSFRKVFLQSACHLCKKELKQARVPCNYCSLVLYCNAKHKDEDWPLHQGLCFAVSTIVHLKDQKHLYADAKNVTGQDYRLLRMQMIVSCERVLKRKLTPWEQEALLYPRMCADPACREWRQSKLTDCDGCGQISYCSNHPSHFPKTHQRWCKSYSLYQKLVCYQQTKGRLEPKLPGKVMTEQYLLPEKINEVLASMFDEKIDLNDVQYAALTQIATAPLTAAYCHQVYGKTSQANGTYKKSSCTIHIVGGELQFEADALNKWEVFFLHLRPQIQELRVVMVGTDLNPSNLPLELLGKVKMCESCRSNKRRVVFSFQDKTTYYDYRANEDFITPDIVCAFNSSIKRSSMYNGKDPWPRTINCILKQKVPFLITSYTLNELHRDLSRVKECSEVDLKVIIDPKYNSFASVRPDRNFISDDEMPLLFKNYCYMLVCGGN